ncbi:hypothetical protein [Corynebacterium sp. A21]|uniref:hypothetical protein n=1 Tax=Corynebacterium sp. A21 TaxID=3457318 RepID=UPI003FD2D5CC
MKIGDFNMMTPIQTITEDQPDSSSNAEGLLTEAMDLLTCIESTLRIADTDTQIAVARLSELYLGADDGDHFPKVLDTITQLRDRIYAHIDQPD